MARHGNLMSMLMDQGGAAEVGQGATVLYYKDRHAGTVVEATEKRVVVQQDTARRTDGHGMSDAQDYEYERNPEGRTWTFTKRRNGEWTVEGYKAGQGPGVAFGVRREFFDYTF